jgi:SAM-dependent methyltransferase
VAEPVEDEPRARLRQARSLGSSDEAVAFYRAWAADYDRDVFERLRFTGTLRIAALLADHCADRLAPAIDLGCGTGHLGAELKRLGFGAVDGLDLSPEMLAVATGAEVYRETIAADLLAPLPVAARQYGAAASAGTFTTGHVDARALDEILRIVAPGGTLAIVVADAFWDAGGFATRLARLEEAGRLGELHRSLEPVREGGPPEGWFLVHRRT